ncbi:oxidoreductase [Tabrizicola sp. TH137]|uniref:aldo/keto reductase n=1 Tax=Tabrizicola sp. TH137 TaxID=2067452 RepID=UPI000C7B0B05|nr:aldo/keto reductase [Tabrizicola sp. TH137]PLL12890.1 oxidoreductase [Tabrizicola sp. TH137]
MERVPLSNGVSLSRIVYGMWRLGDDPDTSDRHIRAKVDTCLEQGITTMDHADIYGGYTVEALFGEAIRGTDLRDRIEIVTKCGIIAPVGDYAEARLKHYDTSRRHVTASVERSLRHLGTDRIDLLLIHRPDPFMDFDETGRALDDLVASGKVLAVGVSNFRPWDSALLQSRMQTPLAVNQIELSLQAREAFTNGDLSEIRLAGMRAMAWSPLGGGSLMTGESALGQKLARMAAEFGVDRSAVAVAWLLAHPAGIMPVMGTNSLDRIRRLSEALSVTLTREDWFDLYSEAEGREVP